MQTLTTHTITFGSVVFVMMLFSNFKKKKKKNIYPGFADATYVLST